MEQDLHIYPWSKDLETGIEILDDQHKKFLMHANRFIIKIKAGKAAEGIWEEFEFIKDYLMYHFQTEETFLYEKNYDKYGEHQAEHLQMKFRTKMVGNALKENDPEKAVKEFVEFVNEWVINHILKSDLEFSRYLKSSGD